jgi:transcription antitermination factor NusG
MNFIDSFNDFFSNFKNQDEIFNDYSLKFKDFWKNLVLNDKVSSLDDSDMDPIIRMMDLNGKGNTKDSIVVARALIRQGQWYRAFRSVKENKAISKIISEIFEMKDYEKLIKKLNELEKANKELKNGITGKNAIILNAMLCLNDPSIFLSALSLEHRYKMQNYLCGIEDIYETFGEKIVNTNKNILEYFSKNGINASPRTISCFIYKIRDKWGNQNGTVIDEPEEPLDNEQTFILEKYLEEFLIGNWESTEIGKKYNLIYSDDNELLSQQFKTDIGKIDILAKEKETNTYVVIELKRNQTSDDTVGQISRYMGWVMEKLANGKPVKGIIIGYENDEKLRYALKTVTNIELFLYRINFSLIKMQ